MESSRIFKNERRPHYEELAKFIELMKRYIFPGAFDTIHEGVEEHKKSLLSRIKNMFLEYISSDEGKCDAFMKKKYGKSFDEIFPIDKYYQVMHLDLFPKGIVHAENLAGDINKLGSTRCYIGCFPLRGIEMESSMCRIVAWLPPKEKKAKK